MPDYTVERARRRQATARMFERPEYIEQGAQDALRTAARYAQDRYRTPSKIPGDVQSFGGMLYEGIKEDPAGFVGDMLFAPFAGVRDFADIRQMARDARAAGDPATARQIEQFSGLAALSAIPVAGPLIARGAGGAKRLAVKAAKRTAKKKGGLAVKKGRR